MKNSALCMTGKVMSGKDERDDQQWFKCWEQLDLRLSGFWPNLLRQMRQVAIPTVCFSLLIFTCSKTQAILAMIRLYDPILASLPHQGPCARYNMNQQRKQSHSEPIWPKWLTSPNLHPDTRLCRRENGTRQFSHSPLGNCPKISGTVLCVLELFKEYVHIHLELFRPLFKVTCRTVHGRVCERVCFRMVRAQVG